MTEAEYAAVNGTAWCGRCRRRVAVADDYASDTGDRLPLVYAFQAVPLYCGHDASGPMRVVGVVDRVAVLAVRC